jgi:hypothetical protein
MHAIAYYQTPWVGIRISPGTRGGRQPGAVNRSRAAVSLASVGKGSGMPGASAHLLDQLAAKGPWGGPSYRYRGAEIHCLPGGHVCGLTMRDHPLDGTTFSVVGPIRSPRARPCPSRRMR